MSKKKELNVDYIDRVIKIPTGLRDFGVDGILDLSFKITRDGVQYIAGINAETLEELTEIELETIGGAGKSTVHFSGLQFNDLEFHSPNPLDVTQASFPKHSGFRFAVDIEVTPQSVITAIKGIVIDGVEHVEVEGLAVNYSLIQDVPAGDEHGQA